MVNNNLIHNQSFTSHQVRGKNNLMFYKWSRWHSPGTNKKVNGAKKNHNTILYRQTCESSNHANKICNRSLCHDRGYSMWLNFKLELWRLALHMWEKHYINFVSGIMTDLSKLGKHINKIIGTMLTTPRL